MFTDRSRKQTGHIKREIKKTCTGVGQRQTGPKEKVQEQEIQFRLKENRKVAESHI